ncbi:hypothetical protein [Aureimonas populi]|nr:hypothetical protein [Aureimonas populi]
MTMKANHETRALTDAECEAVGGGRIAPITTLAVGEEDGGWRATTLAVGEEDGRFIPSPVLDLKIHN